IGIFRWAVWLSVPAGLEAIGNLVVLKYQAKFVLLAKWLLALAIKLQLAVLFSLALVCGRPWKMLLAASVFFSIFVLSSIAI
ncbi:hypothetical protein AB4Y38_43400, partial [Paraburkholderia sp. EG285A]